MKYCSNCGEQIDEKAVICVKCGVPVNGNNVTTSTYNQTSSNVQKQGHGAATASLILGILGVISAVITLIIAICVYAYYSNYTYSYYDLYTVFDSAAKIGVCILLTVLPGILSLIGLPLGCFCRKGGPKIAGIVLNTITLVICVIQIVLIMNA